MNRKRLSACNDPLNSRPRLVLRRRFKPNSWCVAASCCVAMALSPAIAGTNGTTSARITAGSSSSLQASARPDGGSAVVIQGASLAELTQRFWTRFMSIPLNVGPGSDTTGINCGINQSGPVWLLGAPLGAANSLSCTIPVGKVILAPAVTFFNDYPCPDPTFEPAPGQSLEEFLTQGVTPFIDTFTASVQLDGKSLRVRRVTARLQSFTGAKDIASIDACVTGSPQLGVADGLYAVIQPLPPGQHVLEVRSNSSQYGISADNTFYLTIK